MTPASAVRKDANRASLLVSPSRDMLAPPSGQRGTPYAPVAPLNTRPCDSIRLSVWQRNVVGIRFVGRLRPMLGALSGLPGLLERGGRDADDPPQGSHHPGCPRRDCAIAGANRCPGAAL